MAAKSGILYTINQTSALIMVLANHIQMNMEWECKKKSTSDVSSITAWPRARQSQLLAAPHSLKFPGPILR